jgi:tetratricopeptide (TPR) repeat protein
MERAGYNMSVTDQQSNPTISRFLNFTYDLISQQANAAQAGRPTTVGQRTVALPNVADYFAAQQLLPFFNRYLPEKAPTFRVFLDMIYRVVKDQGGDLVAQTTQANTVEEALKDAEAAQDSLQKDLLYFRAALLSLSGSEFDQALSISEKVKDADFRAGLDSIIRAQATAAAIRKNDIDLAFRYAKGISDVRQRAVLLGKIARALIDKKDMVRAREVLDEAEKLIGKAEEGLDRAQAMLIIADAKTRLDPSQGFETMEAAVKEFNRADSSTDEKKPAGGGSILSIMMSKVMRLETPDFDQSFPLLARTDFNRALQLAQAFKKKDRYVLAQLSVCRGVLNKRDSKV